MWNGRMKQTESVMLNYTGQCCGVVVSTLHVGLWCLCRKCWFSCLNINCKKVKKKKRFTLCFGKRCCQVHLCFRCQDKETAERVALKPGELSLDAQSIGVISSQSHCHSSLISVSFWAVWFLLLFTCTWLQHSFISQSRSDLQASVWPNQ